MEPEVGREPEIEVVAEYMVVGKVAFQEEGKVSDKVPGPEDIRWLGLPPLRLLAVVAVGAEPHLGVKAG